MKIKTSELTGAALDWAAAKCEGLELHKDGLLNGVVMEGWHAAGYYMDPNSWVRLGKLRYSTDWSQGGPIIDRERIGLTFHDEGDGWEVPNWGAWPTQLDDRQEVMGETALIAAMRCYVASKLGDEVDVPEELLS